ncbi:secreted trypsin-like serine protease [Actinopolyspora biskrensis]|uniref:Secreted trypsin-like serine protease n=1 Tax=Actinopolyspora biskrensis TaxID=1470178 RepID=A0A852Z9G5_9ACTN|nr:serine protease [Actinopolyspora biskrensis]NYH80186.1 secreted trypsin-like serine protease [Actinopolyspora biskrensis]
MRKRSCLLGAFTALIGAVGLAAPASADGPDTMIVGGHDATEQYSFMASLQSGGRHLCGATLIEPDALVTAAHCVSGGGSYTVRVGSTDHSGGGEQASVTEVSTHPSSDLAVLRLGGSVRAEPIDIAAEAGSPGTATRLLGWGQTCPERGGCGAPRTLQELDTSVVADNECSGIDGSTEICTDNPGGDSGACYGDSGGPQIKGTTGSWKLIGATSRAGNDSPTCATAPSIYTDVTAHSDWIAQQTAN